MTFKKNQFYLYLLLLICSCSTSFAQQAKLDSLKQSLLKQKSDTSKIDILLQLSFGYHQIDISLCRAYGTEALSLSKQLKDTARIAQSHSYLGIADDLEGHSDKAISHWEKCLALSNQIDFLSGKRSCSNNLGIAHKAKGNIEQSLQYFLTALKMYEQSRNVPQTVNTLTNIGNLYRSINEMELANQYLHQAIKKGEQLGRRAVLGHPYLRMGEFFVQQKDYETALPYLQKAYNISKEYAQDLYAAVAIRLLGDCEYALGRSANALASFSEAEQMFIKIGEKYTELHTLYLTWARVYSDQGDINKAFEKAHTGLALATENNLEASKLSSLQLLGLLHEKTNNFQKALEYYKAATTLQDSLHLQTKEELILELETRYQSRKKEMENDLLRSEQEKIQVQLRSKNTFVSAIIFMLVLLGIIAFLLLRAYRNKNRYNKALQVQVAKRTAELENSNKELRQSNEELERFAYITSHDLTEPLITIHSFAGLTAKSLEKNDTQKAATYLDVVKSNAHRMQALVEGILDYSTLKGKTTIQEVDLNNIVEEVKQSLQALIETKKVQLTTNQLPTIQGDQFQLFQLFKNLMENGIKYNENPVPKIAIQYEQQQDKHIIRFKDNGIGIDSAYQDQIFTMFKRLHRKSEYTGIGLGLATVKKIVHNLQGTIELKSQPSEGSEFIITIPVEKLPSQRPMQKVAATFNSL